MAGAPKANVDHPLLDRANRIRAHLDAGKLDQADAEIDAAIKEAQTMPNAPDFVSANRPIIEAVLGAYRERGKGLGAHPELTKPGRLEQGRKVAFVRDHMRALLAGQPAPTPPAAPTPATAPTAPATPAAAPATPSPAAPATTPVASATPTPAPTAAPTAAPAAAPAAPGKIPDALKAKAHPRAVKIIETVIDLMAVAADEAALKAKLDEKKIQYGKDDAAKTMTVKNLARALKAIQNHKPPLLQNLETVTEVEHIHNRAGRIEEIFDRCYVNIAFRQLLTSTKKTERQRGREMIEAVGQKDEAKELIEIIQAIRQSGKEIGVAQLREKIFGSQAIGKTTDALKKDPAIEQILDEAKGKGLNPHRIIQSVDKAEGAQPATSSDELHVKVKAVLGRMKEIIERVKQENGRPAAAAPASRPAPAPAPAPAAPAAPASAPAAPTSQPRTARGVPPEITTLPKAIRESAELKTLAEKIKAVFADPTALATAKSLTKSPFIKAIFVDLEKGVMTTLKKARGKPFRTESQIIQAIKKAIRTLDKLLRGEIVVAAPTPPAPAAPAAPAPTSVPATPSGPAPVAPPTPTPPEDDETEGEIVDANLILKEDLTAIQPSSLREAIAQATETNPEDRDNVIRAWELYHKDAEGCPRLKIFQNKIKKNLDYCIQLAKGENPGDADVLVKVIENLLDQLRQELNNKTIEALEKEPDEKALREELVGLYFNMEDLTPKMQDLLKILEIDPSEADAGPERIHLKRVQSTIRKVLYEEIPQAINTQTVGKDLKEKVRLLQQIDDQRTIETTLAAIQGRLTSLDNVICGLPDKFKRGLTALAPAPTVTPVIPAGVAAASIVAPIAAPAAVAPLAGSAVPGTTPAPVQSPALAARLATDYPAKGGEIKRVPHIVNLMRNVLQNRKLYTDNFKGPTCRALENLLYNRENDISMAELEQFLLRPNIPTNQEIMTLQNNHTKAQLEALKSQTERQSEDIKRHIISLENRLSTHRGGAEETADIHEQLQRYREGEVDINGNVTVVGRNQLEARLQNIKNAIFLKTGNRQYGSVREVLALIHIYLRQNGIESGPMNEVDIADKMEKEIQAQREMEREAVWHRHLHLNFMKPTLEDTLQHLARKDGAIKRMGVENMSKLASAHKNGIQVEDWIENLGDPEYHYKTSIPRLIAYLEFAVRDAGSTHLNSFSQERAKSLINHLRAARIKYVTEKLRNQTDKLSDNTDKMIAYFQELERHTMDETQINKELITRHSGWTLVKRSMPVAGIGLAMPFLGVTLMPLVLGGAAVGGGVNLAHKAVGKFIPKEWLEGKTKTVVRGAVATALVAGISTLGLIAWPAALLGGVAASLPDIIRNRDLLWKGTKATARVGGTVGSAVGGAALGGARRIARGKGRNPPPAAT